MNAPNPSTEEYERLQALRDYHLLDTAADDTLDELTKLASNICETPVALVSLIDEHRQWFLSKQGLAITETPRDQAFCNIAIQSKQKLLEVPDALGDARFSDNPMVTGNPNIRFYAGVPLVTSEGHALGTLCVIDRKPRQLTEAQREALRIIANQCMQHIEMRGQVHRLASAFGDAPPSNAKPAERGDRTLGIFRRKIYLGFALAVLTMAALAVVGYSALMNESRSAERVTHTREVIGQIETLRGQIGDIETGARGFFATGEDAFLAAYRSASRDLPLTLSRLGALIADNPVQVARMTEARTLIDDQLVLLTEGIRYRTQERQASLPLMRRGKEIKDQFRAVIAEMQTEEERLLAARGAQSMRDSQRTLLVLAMGFLSGLGMVVWLFRIVLRESAKREQIARQLQRSGALHSAILQNTNLAVIAVGLDDRITVFNRAAELMLRYRADEVVGRYTPAIFHEPHEVAARATELSRRLGQPVAIGMPVFTTLPKLGQTDECEWTYIRKDGRRVPVRLSIVALRDAAGDVAGYVGVAADITERRRDMEALRKSKEEAEEATRVKSAFLATMSHEIRTPMNGVIGMTSLLLDTELTEDQREFTEVIRVSGETLLVVINDILDYSKIESGKMDFESQPIDLQEALESTIELLALRAQEKQLDLMFFIEPDVPRWIYGDLARLRQILVNLLSNAIKFTPWGEVFLYVKCVDEIAIPDDVRDMSTSITIEFSVRDTGIGIPQDKIDKLFAAFTQVDSSVSRKFGGSGLGLVISRRLAEGMGGEMWVHSRVGEGSTFAFTLPTSPAPALTPAAEMHHDALHGKRVLLVDDNATNLRILSLQAETWGMLPTAVREPKEAIALATRTPVADEAKFSAVITDMHMPDMNGVDVAKAIHAVMPSLPIILLSSGSSRSDETRANFSSVLTKPARQSSLHDAVVRAFHRVPTHATVTRKTNENSFDHDLAKRYPLRILLAEDNDINQKLALRVLKNFGYLADVAANGYEVLAAVKRQTYDLVLMDVQMPDMDGLEATQQILSLWPDAEKRPHITAMSANAMREDVDAAVEAGMDDYVTKPISIGALRAALESCGKIKSPANHERLAAIADK
jgi:PAS domain S-box-containing protein